VRAKNIEKLFSFEDLIVWQKAVDFADIVIHTIDDFNAPRKHYRTLPEDLFLKQLLY